MSEVILMLKYEAEIVRLRKVLEFIAEGISCSITPEDTADKFRSAARAALKTKK